jgi:hypothetical protein
MTTSEKLHETYPNTNLFLSNEWIERIRTMGFGERRFVVDRFKNLRVAKLSSGILGDVEPWPQAGDTDALARELAAHGEEPCDWLVYRKLMDEHRPPGTEGLHLFPYSVSPWLDLTRPLKPKKEVIAHIGRTERKISREVAPLRMRVASDAEPGSRERWFAIWSSFEKDTGRFNDGRLEMYRTWTCGGPLPPWMRLMTLEAGDLPIASGLFYVWNGVFHYFGPVMNQQESLRKYGPGKLFVQKLIEYAQADGCGVFDFLQGGHEYKFHWFPQIRVLQQAIVPLSLKGRLALSGFRLRRWVRPAPSLVPAYPRGAQEQVS